MEPLVQLLVGNTIAEVWEQSIPTLLTAKHSYRVSTTTGGDTWELENVVMQVLAPLSEPRVSNKFTSPNLINDYGKLLTRQSSRQSVGVHTIYDRIYGWRETERKRINQMKGIQEELEKNRASRRAVICIWDPVLDLSPPPEAAPIGHCVFYFSIRNNALNLCVVSRSVDAWIGAVPDMVAFTLIQKKLADELSISVGPYTHHIFSYHIYLHDIPKAREVFRLSNST